MKNQQRNSANENKTVVRNNKLAQDTYVTLTSGNIFFKSTRCLVYSAALLQCLENNNATDIVITSGVCNPFSFLNLFQIP